MSKTPFDFVQENWTPTNEGKKASKDDIKTVIKLLNKNKLWNELYMIGPDWEKLEMQLPNDKDKQRIASIIAKDETGPKGFDIEEFKDLLKQNVPDYIAEGAKISNEGNFVISDEIWSVWDAYFDERDMMEMGNDGKGLVFDIETEKVNASDLKSFFKDVKALLKTAKKKFKIDKDQIQVTEALNENISEGKIDAFIVRLYEESYQFWASTDSKNEVTVVTKDDAIDFMKDKLQDAYEYRKSGEYWGTIIDGSSNDEVARFIMDKDGKITEKKFKPKKYNT